MYKETFVEELKEASEYMKIVESVFPNVFTDFEKMTIVLKIMNHSYLETIGDQLTDEDESGIANGLWAIHDIIKSHE